MQIALDELDAQPEGPKLLAGDLNSDIDDNLPIMTAIADGKYTDLGSCPHLAREVNQPTCYPPNHNQPHRRDFAFISTTSLPFVVRF
eukprot:9067631-Karenia_brevis.AAC.1